jgi:hypothetical protein
MKNFLVKFIKDLQESQKCKIPKINEKNLIPLIEFYKLIKDDLSVIENIVKKPQWFMNSGLYSIDEKEEKSFIN